MKPTIAYNSLSKPTFVMAKSVGAMCNLKCDYCYYLEKEQLYAHRLLQEMNDDILERFIKSYIEAQPTDVQFTWHGGEPLLRDLSFYKKVIYFQKKYAKGKQIENVLQTNGTLINDEWCEFFKDNRFLIGISIDGPEHCHDKYRRSKTGKSSFAQVMRGIEQLKKHRVDFNTLSVINDYTVRFPQEIYSFFKEIGSNYMQFSPVVERLTAQNRLLPPLDIESTLASWSVNTLAFGHFYTQIFDEWVQKDVGVYFVQLFDATLAGTLGVLPGVCLFAQTCGHALSMEANGDMYSCDHFVFPGYKIGNIKTKTVYEMAFSEEQLKFGDNKRDLLPRQCVKCEFLHLCNGECPKNRICYSQDGEWGLNYLCAGYKIFFAHSMPYMKFMADEIYAKRPPANVMNFFPGK